MLITLITLITDYTLYVIGCFFKFMYTLVSLITVGSGINVGNDIFQKLIIVGVGLIIGEIPNTVFLRLFLRSWNKKVQN